MPMSDEEAYRHYADPDNREPAGPGQRRSRQPLSAHVPVRFRPEIIAEVKILADEDRKTVSSWIRDLVEREVEHRRPRPVITVLSTDMTITGFDGPFTIGNVTGVHA